METVITITIAQNLDMLRRQQQELKNVLFGESRIKPSDEGPGVLWGVLYTLEALEDVLTAKLNT